jgi:hypothetical protein
MSKLPYKIFAVFFILLLNVSPAKSEERGIGDIIVVKNNTGSDKTDFHITVESDTPMNVTPVQLSASLFVNMADPAATATVGGQNTNTLTFDWDVNIPAGASIVAGFHAVQEEENKFTVKSHFTPQNSPTDVPVLGWRVTPLGEVYLDNSYSEDIIFDDLTFTLLDELVFDDLLALAISDSSGLLSNVTMGAVGAESELFVGQFMQLDPGEFLTARMSLQFSDPNFSSLTSEQLLIHEGQIPEPKTIALVLIGLWFLRKPYGTLIKG